MVNQQGKEEVERTEVRFLFERRLRGVSLAIPLGRSNIVRKNLFEAEFSVSEVWEDRPEPCRRPSIRWPD